MNADLSRKRLSTIKLSQLESYLISTHWVNDGNVREVATIWHREDSEDAEVVLPASPQLKDFLQGISDALEALALYERRDVVEVARDVLRYLADLITVRVIGGDTDDGTIPINDGVMLNVHARDLLNSAALSMYSKRRHFSGAPPKEARTYLDSLLLGQTEIGSYVVNVIAPVPSPSGSPDGADATNIASVVTANLSSSLDALTQAAEEYAETEDLSVFDAAVQRGASANMCDALIGFSGNEHKRTFEIKISTAPTSLFEGETKVFSFDPAQVSRLAKAAEYYKDNYVLPDRTVYGYIKRLDRTKGETTGTVTVASTISGQEKNVAFELQTADYDRAILAHKANLPVLCSGELHVTPRTATLVQVHDFRVISTGELFE